MNCANCGTTATLHPVRWESVGETELLCNPCDGGTKNA